jgi:hypothetical protein
VIDRKTGMILIKQKIFTEILLIGNASERISA